jgi:hypothetical protein
VRSYSINPHDLKSSSGQRRDRTADTRIFSPEVWAFSVQNEDLRRGDVTPYLIQLYATGAIREHRINSPVLFRGVEYGFEGQNCQAGGMRFLIVVHVARVG